MWTVNQFVEAYPPTPTPNHTGVFFGVGDVMSEDGVVCQLVFLSKKLCPQVPQVVKLYEKKNAACLVRWNSMHTL